MYLKQLDILGFKSFADRTRLTFEPGMIAIVGPNGCGKSNVSDSIRWVLGEQRPTAIRCSKLVDVVFNGTDTRKPLGMAEVSITFADCEGLLGTEYHEVTVTRRVYRDGSGEYFINKTKCGLKDVKRLFMGTGIGTTSYSVMAQGQIDQILSSKPEDRRAVFEEAAGITKFKADRKEALRKIEQTEQNLLREADVLREMKRQIGSLQRQVGKAERYKELHNELRGLDIYVSKGKIQAFNLALEMNAANQRETEQKIQDATVEVNAAESASQQIHADMHQLEERLAALQAQQAQAESAYARAREVIGVNEQRIAEYRAWSDRDGREINATRQQLEEIGMQTDSLAQKTSLLEEGLESAKAALEDAENAFNAASAKIDELRQTLQEARTESVACDRHAAEVRDNIAQIEAQAREQYLKRERLVSEEEQLKANVASIEETLAAVRARLDEARAAEEAAATASETAEEERAALMTELENLRVNFGQMQADAAAKEAQLDVLRAEAANDEEPEEENPESISAKYGTAAERLLGDVYLLNGKIVKGKIALPVVSSNPNVPGIKYVTTEGVVKSDLGLEVWVPSKAAQSAVNRKIQIADTEKALEELHVRIEKGRQTLATGTERSAALAEQVKTAAATLTAARRAAAQAEGEYGSVERDATTLRDRLARVSAELAAVKAANAGDDAKRAALAEDLEATLAKRDALMDRTASQQEELQQLEILHGDESRRLTERRISAAQMENELQLTAQQNADAERRRDELQKMIAGREAGIRGYEDSIQRLRDETAELMGSLDDLKQGAVDIHGAVEQARVERTELQSKLSAFEGGVGAKRAALDRAREFKGKLEVAATEATMRRQNIYEHLQNEYGLDAQAVLREPDPDWKGGEPPPNDVLEERVNALNAQLTALGPVNMVAIEEFRELEERYAKEKEQEADLLAAKEQILALITNLNDTSGQMFRSTFEQANQNFQRMFTKLFNGGEARLVLLENAEDPLECGIDIIARPPGKRPQSVTLLSGGERTMTAVALLFAIFMIKPAPFCMLDELDAALDDANIGRFVDALKEFLDRSQFLIITHNQHTIAGSDLVYGVSQQEKGISRIISMRLTDIGVKPLPEDKPKDAKKDGKK